MRFAEYPPSPRFARIVERYWILEGQGTGAPDAVLPDGRLELIFHYGVVFHRHQTGGRIQRQTPTLVSGQITEPVVLSFTGAAGVAAIRLQPAAARAVLGCSSAELTGHVLDLAAVLPSTDDRDDVTGRLEEAGNDLQRVAVLERWLSGLVVGTPAPAVEFVANQIIRSAGRASVATVAARAGLSVRSLQRTFLRDVGVSTKHFARIVRLQAALRQVRSGAPLADGAVWCGYYDQAHMALDFRQLAAVSPTAWRDHSGELAPLFAGC